MRELSSGTEQAAHRGVGAIEIELGVPRAAPAVALLPVAAADRLLMEVEVAVEPAPLGMTESQEQPMTALGEKRGRRGT